MVGEIVLEQIWHLRHVGDTEDRWLFSVNYKVPLESSTVRNSLQGETDPPISIVEHVDLLDRSRVLVTEIRGRTEYDTEISDGEFTIKATRRLDRLMRKPTRGPRPRVNDVDQESICLAVSSFKFFGRHGPCKTRCARRTAVNGGGGGRGVTRRT